MTGMTPEAAQKLRAPFAPELIGKLPKGGAMLDYVGHAAVTDRLLQVDPEWTWEPFATGPDGLPAVDREGNLWIRLTVAGVTRTGVGDGKSAKERIGDALRNAAMRFGVALDLWSKEDLAAFAQAEQERQAQAALTPEERAERAVTQAQQRRQERNSQRSGPAAERGRAWDAVTEWAGVNADQATRQHEILAELARRSWPDPQSLSAEHWTTLAEHYEEKADDDIRARIARGE